MTTLLAFALLLAAMLVIWRASDGFETAAGYLGRNFADGVRGATFNAVGSSMPELLTVVVGLLFYADVDGFSVGIGTSAGSALFNSAIIPALVIIAVVIGGLAQRVTVSRKVILRDGFWLLFCLLLLVWMLAGGTLNWWHGAILVGCYAGYLVYLFSTMTKLVADEPDDSDAEPTAAARLPALLSLDLRTALLGNARLRDGSAWGLLVVATIVIGIACFVLVESIYLLADAWDIRAYFVAVILAAAATSVPDTILSIRDAQKGNYDDAVANALGSNIFDIAIGLGLPLMLFTLFTGEPLVIGAGDTGSVAELQALLLIFTVVVLGIFLAGTSMGMGKAVLLLALYASFVVYIVGTALQHPLALQIGQTLQGWTAGLPPMLP